MVQSSTSDKMHLRWSRVIHTLLGTPIMVKGFFTSVLGAPALNMGGIRRDYLRFLGLTPVSQYCTVSCLMPWPSSTGNVSAPFVIILWSVDIFIMAVVEGRLLNHQINNFGLWIATSQNSTPIVSPLPRDLSVCLPFGLHHMLTIPTNHNWFRWVYQILLQTRLGKCSVVKAHLLAWASDLAHHNIGDDVSSRLHLEKNWTLCLK